MRFDIDFNREEDDTFLLSLGAEWEDFGGFSRLIIDLADFEDLEKLLKKVDKEKEGIYSAVVSFDPPTIFLDCEI